MKAILWIFAIYAAYCVLLFLLQRQVIYPRYAIDSSAPATPNAGGTEKTWIETRHGKSECWYLPPKRGPESGRSPAVIFAHGNAELIDHWPEELWVFTSLGIGVLLVEYPGYGRSTGSPSQRSITRTFVAAHDMLTERPDVDPARVIFFGRSLGGGAVCALLRERPAAAVILMSTFTSVRSLAAKRLVPAWLVRDPYDNLAAVAAYNGPLLVIHGEHDDMIPFSHGAAIARTAANGRLLSYPCGHVDFPPGWFDFHDAVRAFLKGAGIIQPDRSPRNGSEWRATR